MFFLTEKKCLKASAELSKPLKISNAAFNSGFILKMSYSLPFSDWIKDSSILLLEIFSFLKSSTIFRGKYKI